MFLKVKQFVVTLVVILAMATPAFSCVGKTLYVGAVDSPGENILAEILVLLINERTGTSVQVRYHADKEKLYAALQSAVEAEHIDIMIENTIDGARQIGLAAIADPEQAYLAVKEKYEKQLNVIWLNPFGFTNGKPGGSPSVSAPLLRRDILTNFPLLPRILNKLGNAIDNATFAALVAEVKGGAKPKNVAKDFLKSRKFI